MQPDKAEPKYARFWTVMKVGIFWIWAALALPVQYGIAMRLSGGDEEAAYWLYQHQNMVNILLPLGMLANLAFAIALVHDLNFTMRLSAPRVILVVLLCLATLGLGGIVYVVWRTVFWKRPTTLDQRCTDRTESHDAKQKTYPIMWAWGVFVLAGLIAVASGSFLPALDDWIESLHPGKNAQIRLWTLSIGIIGLLAILGTVDMVRDIWARFASRPQLRWWLIVATLFSDGLLAGPYVVALVIGKALGKDPSA